MQPSAAQMMVRITPKRPKDAPSRITLPWLDGIGRRFYAAEEGFVLVPTPVANLLRDIHCDGELTERGGQGPLLFDVMTPEQAHRIAQIEEKRALVEAAGRDGNNGLRAALASAGTYTDEDLANLGIDRPVAPTRSAAEIARGLASPQEQAPSVGAPPPTSADAPADPPKARVGRRPPRGKAPLPGATS